MEYKVCYTQMVGGKTFEYLVTTEGLKRLLDAAERYDITLHWIQILR